MSKLYQRKLFQENDYLLWNFCGLSNCKIGLRMLSSQFLKLHITQSHQNKRDVTHVAFVILNMHWIETIISSHLTIHTAHPNYLKINDQVRMNCEMEIKLLMNIIKQRVQKKCVCVCVDGFFFRLLF